MHINVSDRQEVLVNQLVKSGGYASADEWLQELIFEQILQANPDYKAELDASLEQALVDIAAGKGQSLDEAVEELKAEIKVG